MEKEREAIDRMKDGRKYFLTYTKNLRKSSGIIGLFTDKNNKVIDQPVVETLKKQYASMCSVPLKEFEVSAPESFFKTSV